MFIYAHPAPSANRRANGLGWVVGCPFGASHADGGPAGYVPDINVSDVQRPNNVTPQRDLAGRGGRGRRAPSADGVWQRILVVSSGCGK